MFLRLKWILSRKSIFRWKLKQKGRFNKRKRRFENIESLEKEKKEKKMKMKIKGNERKENTDF